MLRAEDNKFLIESGSGTGMGELLRRFWIPVLLSEELPEADGTPKKILVMGEELLAFRDTRGVVGVIDQYCPHRGANLWLGRNEECGIRCVYHGWKFDTDGRCVDMPTSYHDLNAKDLIRIKSTRRGNGATLGHWKAHDPDTAHFPPSKRISPSRRKRARSSISKSFVNPLVRVATDHMRWIAEDPRPVIRSIRTRPASRSPVDNSGTDNIYWRIAQFLMPCAYASSMPGENISAGFVPVTETSCWIYTYAWNPNVR
jgi:nitrite reductase/ring-hydroxylating ferredoxin subunit